MTTATSRAHRRGWKRTEPKLPKMPAQCGKLIANDAAWQRELAELRALRAAAQGRG